MELTIANNEQLDAWLNERRKMERDVFSIKGTPPEGATYSDGGLITRPVNIAWRDGTTGEVFSIEYEVPNVEVQGRTAGFSAERPLQRRVGGHGQGEDECQ